VFKISLNLPDASSPPWGADASAPRVAHRPRGTKWSTLWVVEESEALPAPRSAPLGLRPSRSTPAGSIKGHEVLLAQHTRAERRVHRERSAAVGARRFPPSFHFFFKNKNEYEYTRPVLVK